MEESNLQPLEARVCESLRRQNFQDFKVTHLGDGVIHVELSEVQKNDKALAIAIARTVVGVTSVTS